MEGSGGFIRINGSVEAKAGVTAYSRMAGLKCHHYHANQCVGEKRYGYVQKKVAEAIPVLSAAEAARKTGDRLLLCLNAA
jgi:hypothetical protein